MFSIPVFIVIAVLAGLLFRIYSKLKYNKIIPPGPKGYPIVGNILDLHPKETVENFRKFRRQYGDLFTIHMGKQPTVVVNGYDNIKEPFSKKEYAVNSRPSTFLFRDLFQGYGIGPSSGTIWKVHRAFAMKTLRSLGFEKGGMESKIIEEVKTCLKEVERHEKMAFNHDEIFKMCTTNVICLMAFGQRFDHIDRKFKTFLSLIGDIFKYTGISGPVSIFPFLKYLPGDPFGGKQLLKTFKAFLDFIEDFIDEHRISLDSENIRDYIDAYLKEKTQINSSERDTFTDYQLKVTVAELFIAGTESTVITLKWFVLYLLHYPHVQTKMWTELEAVVGVSGLPSLSDRPNLPYCEAVITEVMRCADPALFGLMHCASEDVHINNLIIPKGCNIIKNLDSVLKDPGLFPNPEEFRPERFITNKGMFRNHEKVIPFSVGRRVCIGESFARASLFLFSTSLVQRFKILPEKGKPIPPLEGVYSLNHTTHSYDWFPVKRLLWDKKHH